MTLIFAIAILYLLAIVGVNCAVLEVAPQNWTAG